MSTTQPTSTTSKVTATAFSVDVIVTTRIGVPAARCWDVLASTDDYPSWNPFIRRFKGPLSTGQKVEVELHLDGRKPQTMTPKIVELTSGVGFQWLGGFGFRGVFDGLHRFEIRPLEPEACELVHSEHLSGILVPLFKKMLTGPTPDAFVAMNNALKARVEHGN